jgi:hypothetical protein
VLDFFKCESVTWVALSSSFKLQSITAQGLMTHPKRPKSQNKGSKGHAVAKQAAQKRLKDHRATKFRNEDLRTMLNMETSVVYFVRFRYLSGYVLLSLMLCAFLTDQREYRSRIGKTLHASRL